MEQFSPEEVGLTLAGLLVGVMEQDQSQPFREALGFGGRGFLPWGETRKSALLVDLEISALFAFIYLQACQQRIRESQRWERLLTAFYGELEKAFDPDAIQSILRAHGYESLRDFCETRRAEYEVREKEEAVDNAQSYVRQGRHRVIADAFGIEPLSEQYLKLVITTHTFWWVHFPIANEVALELLP